MKNLKRVLFFLLLLSSKIFSSTVEVSTDSSLASSDEYDNDEDYYYYDYETESSSDEALVEDADESSYNEYVDSYEDHTDTDVSGDTSPTFDRSDEAMSDSQTGRFKFRSISNVQGAKRLPMANDLTLNRTQYLFSCRLKRRSRLDKLNDLRNQVKIEVMRANSLDEVKIVDDKLLNDKLLAMGQKTDIIKSQREAAEATALAEKTGGRGMSAAQRKAFADQEKEKEKSKDREKEKEGEEKISSSSTASSGSKAAPKDKASMSRVAASSGTDSKMGGSSSTNSHSNSNSNSRSSEESTDKEDNTPKSKLQLAKEAKLRQLNRGSTSTGTGIGTGSSGSDVGTSSASASAGASAGVSAASAVPQIELGPDCAGYMCQSCKQVMREAVHAIIPLAKDTSKSYADEVLTAGLCATPGVTGKYVSLFRFLCEHYFLSPKLWYYDAILRVLSGVQHWEALSEPASLTQVTRDACLEVGACSVEMVDFRFEAGRREEEDWTEKCFICQAFASQLEERVSLLLPMNEAGLSALVQDVCAYMNLSAERAVVCREIYGTKGRLRSLVYLTRVLSDGLVKTAKGEKKFADGVCEELKYCVRWEDPYQKMMRSNNFIYN